MRPLFTALANRQSVNQRPRFTGFAGRQPMVQRAQLIALANRQRLLDRQAEAKVISKAVARALKAIG